jgi:sugar lactone lactonase YvrE
VVLAACFFAAANLLAQPVVKTLGGGPLTTPCSSTFGFVNGNTPQFHTPVGLALDGAGRLFVADRDNNAVREITLSANLTTTFTTNQLNKPVGVALDAWGNLYVLNQGNGANGTVVKFDSFGKQPTNMASGLVNANGIALDASTNIYLTLGNLVARISPSGTMTTVATADSGSILQGIVVMDTGSLAVCDSGRNGVLLINPATGLVTTNSGFNGAGDTFGPKTVAQFNQPHGIAEAGGGNLVVTDFGNNRVKVVSPLGVVTNLYGIHSNCWIQGSCSAGIYPGWWDGSVCPNGPDLCCQQGYAEARSPAGVLVDSDGSVYTTEDFYHLVRHVTSTGLTGPPPPCQRPLFNSPKGLALDNANANLYIADFTNNAVEVLNLGNNQTTMFTTNGINRPVGVAVDPSGNIFVLNQGTSGNGSLLKFDVFGNLLATNASGLSLPTAFTLSGATTFFVTEQSGAVEQFNGGNSNLVVTIATNAAVQLSGIAIFDDGTLAVSDSGNHVIWQVNPLTRTYSLLTGTVGAPGNTLGSAPFAKLNQPKQLARAGGNLLVAADFGNNRLVVVDRSGAITNSLNSTNALVWFGVAGDPFASSIPCFVPMASPFGMVVDSSGAVFASEDSYNDIRKLLGTGLTAPPSAVQLSLFNAPMGLALDNANANLYVSDFGNSAVEVLNLGNNQTTSFVTATNGLSRPVGVAVDPSGSVFVLNQGTGGNGSLLKFDVFGNLLATKAAGLALPTALTLSGATTFFVAEQGGAVQQFDTGGSNLVVVIATNAAVQLSGIAMFDDGTLAVSDAGNHVIWQINPLTKAVSLLTGTLGTPGATLGTAPFVKLNQPRQLARAGGNLLVVADSGNNRLAVVDRSGSVTNVLNSTNALVWFGVPGDPFGNTSSRFVPMATPVGVVVGTGGAVFTSEDFYNDIREVLGTGLTQPGQSSTNFVVAAPIISPNSGYFPMGQLITVASVNPNIYYTTDGSEPTTNSLFVVLTNNVGTNFVGTLAWFNSTNDLTGLRVKAFIGTNGSSTVSGVPASANTIGVPPGPSTNGMLFAGIGSTIVVPVVVNLQPAAQVRSYVFRVEITPNSGTNSIGPVFQTLTVSSNDFIQLVTAAQGNSTLSVPDTPYTIGPTRGLLISSAGNGNYSFQRFAVVALLEVPIPRNASVGDTYSIVVNNASATSDGGTANVPLTAMPAATIMVANIPYTVGDSASALGGWYNAGIFGDGNLDNADVNNAFYASIGLRVPYSFTDVFNAMDAYPPDAPGTVGGDGQIRFLDWQVILRRAVRLDTNNFARMWSAGGNLVAVPTNLVTRSVLRTPAGKLTLTSPWNRQVLLGALSVNYAAAGNVVNVPVYVKLANAASLAGLQFRVVVTPPIGAQPLTQPPLLTMAAGLPGPSFQQNFQLNEKAAGWPLGSFDFLSQSSNFLGWLSFVLPAGAQSGHVYTVSFANVDGAPDLNTQYDFETRSAYVGVNTFAPAPSICSDEWKLHFFGSLTAPSAGDLADPDGDGAPNWMEYLAGTDPTDPASRLRFTAATSQLFKGQPQMALQWLSAPGKLYEIQSAPALTGAPWTTLATMPGDGSVTTATDTNVSGAVRYYRLHLLP